MRPSLFAIALVAFVVAGCDRAPQRSAPTPASSGSPSPSANPSATVTPVRETTTPSATPDRVQTPTRQQICDDANGPAVGGYVATLTLDPVAPRGGERVHLTGRGLTPGDYTASVYVPFAEGGFVNEAPVLAVSADGVLDAFLNWPASQAGHCSQMAIYQVDRGGHNDPNPTRAKTRAFLAAGNLVTPGRCETLPPPIWMTRGGTRGTISPPPYRVGESITISGRLGRGWGDSLTANSFLLFAPAPDPSFLGPLQAAHQTWGADGNFTYTFVPAADPKISGRCVEVAVFGAPTSGDAAYVLARFNYP